MSARTRFTRRQVLAAGAVATGAAVLAVEEVTSNGRTAPRLGAHRRVYQADFALAEAGWGTAWAPLHYEGRLATGGSAARFIVPDGLRGAAKHQPMPVQLLDHECGECEQLVSFAVSDPALRPGLMFAGHGPLAFHAVTAEGARLVLARYGTEGRDIIGEGPTGALAAGMAVHLRVQVIGGRVRARMWRTGDGEPTWQLDVPAAAAEAGTPGIVVVQPTNRRASSLEVTTYALGAAAFAPTRPNVLLALTGVPIRQAGGATSAAARIWSAYPAEVTFESSGTAGFAGARSSRAIRLERPPYTAVETLPVGPGRLFWRARLRSLSADAEMVTEPHEVATHDPEAPLALLAASCVQVMGPPPNAGFRRLQDAASVRPAALVFQGDLGYANNRTDAAYHAAPDYFADRFARFFADPHFELLRRVVPTGFTIDDHEYGPENNADRTTVEPWAIALWNRIHADPSPRGYFDFRFGDVHCLTLDGRRYADPVLDPNTPAKTKLGREQFDWLRHTLEQSDARLYVVFSADSFAHRENPRHPQLRGARLDCFAGGWPAEYRRVMTLFMDMQLHGKRVVVMSGDAHGLRIHYHPDPRRRPEAARLQIVEFICSGLRPLLWSGPVPTDPTLDPRRNVIGHPGGGLIEIDPQGTPGRSILLRAVNARESDPIDAFPPLRIAFGPANDHTAVSA